MSSFSPKNTFVNCLANDMCNKSNINAKVSPLLKQISVPYLQLRPMLALACVSLHIYLLEHILSHTCHYVTILHFPNPNLKQIWTKIVLAMTFNTTVLDSVWKVDQLKISHILRH